MIVGLHDAEFEHIKGKSFPNYALMKISAWHKQQGDTVEMFTPIDPNAAEQLTLFPLEEYPPKRKANAYDIVYSSKVFDFTPENPYLPANAIKGGTGYDIKSQLPPEIDEMFPDYSIYPDCDYAIGYITRGCPNKCPWCVVPKKEGGIKPYRHWQQLVRSDSKKLVLMDNNILSCEYGIAELESLIGSGYSIDLNQGMDARLVDERIASILARLKWIKYIRFSCDQKAQIDAILKTAELLEKHGVKPYRLFIYVLVTKDIDDAAYRVERLRELHNISLYAQAERNEAKGIIPNRAQLEFAQRYVYGRGYKKETWREYCGRWGTDFKEVGSILIDTSQADKSLAKTDSGAKNFTTSLGNGIKTAAKWSAGIVTAAAGAGAGLTKMASDYDDSFAKVKTLLKGSEEEIALYKDRILEASNDTSVGVEEMSEAVYSSLSAGVDQSGVVEFAEKANKLAKGGFTDIQTSVDVMTTALNAYNMESAEAGRVTDVLITTQNLGKTTVSELASSMGKIIPLASAYNVDIENLGASYATLTASGIATAESTTYVKSMFTELSKENTKVAKILKEKTGKAFSELMSDGKSVGDVIDILSESVNGDATAFAGLWSSTEAGAGALAIMNNGAENFNKTLGEMQESAGATDKAFETMQNTLSAKIEKITNSVKNMGISLGEKLVPIVESFVDLVIENIPTIQGLIEKLEPVLKSAFDGIVPTIMELSQSLLPSVIDLVNALLPQISDVMTTLSPIISALIEKLVPVAVKIIEKLLPPLVKILDALMPILDVVFALLDPILDVLLLLLDPIAELLALAADLITVLVDMAKTALEPLKPILDVLIELFKDRLSVALETIMGIVSGVVESFKGAAAFLSGDFTGAVESFGTAMVGNFQTAFNMIDGLFGTSFGKWYNEVTSFWRDAGAKLYEVLHADEINEIELQSKYGSLDTEIVQRSNQYMREGLSAAEAMEKSMNEVLDTSEKLYYFQNNLENGMNERFGTAEERYAKVSKQNKELSVGFQESLSEVTEIASESTDEIIRSFQEMNSDISDINTEAIEEYKQKLDQTVSDTANSYDEMLDAAKQTQEDEVTAFKRAKEDELSALKETNQKEVEDLKETQKAQSEEIKARHKEESDLLKQKQEAALEIYKRGHSERISMIDEEYMEQLKLVDEEAYNRMKAAQDEINAIDAKTAKENKAREEKRIKEERDALSLAVITAKDAEERQKAQKKLNEFDEEQNRKKTLELREQRKEELEQEISNIKTTAEEKKKKLEQERDERIAAENKVFDTETRNLQEIQAIQTAALSEKQEEELKELENVQKAALENLEAINKQKETDMKRLHEDELTGLKRLHSQRLDDIRTEKEETVARIKEQNAIDLEEYKKLIADKQKELDTLKPSENVVEIVAVKPGGEMAAYYQRQGEAKLKENELPHYASGGIAYGKTAAVIGDNQNASIDPEVVAPLSELKKILNNDEQNELLQKIYELLAEILAILGENQPMTVNLVLKNGTKFATWLIDNINEIKRTSGREVFI